MRVFKTRPWSISLLGVFLALMLIMFWEPFQSYFFSVVGRDASLTGRSDLWDDLIAVGSRHSLIGTGFGGFWVGDQAHNLWDTYIWKPNQGHNGYIDVFVDLGFIGLGLLAGAIFTAFRNAWRNILNNVDIGLLQFTVLFLICLNNVSESSLVKTSTLFWFLFLLFAMKFQRSVPQ
jgi:exopolysaccharide production protein ExoQ